jgi:hypothetical protein
MQGPAGAGKSTVAQTLSEALGVKLAATFFFSRANHWNQPEKFIPTIGYQLCTKYPSYRKAIEAIIDRDPFVLQMNVEAQFQELIVKPLRLLSFEEHEAIIDTIIIVDGLDECDGVDAQRDIIATITKSAANGTSPFLWAIFSRPEPYIVSTFTRAIHICWFLTLPAASYANEDIEAILRDGLETIRVKHHLQANWTSERDMGQLVEQADGIFIYTTTAIRFLDGNQDSESAGSRPQSSPPGDRLQALLASPGGSRSHLSKLDQLYLLIMDQVPKDTLPLTLLVLSARHFTNAHTIPVLSSVLGIPEVDIRSSLRTLHPVVEETGDSSHSLRYIHTSFIDFLVAVERSTPEYCIKTRIICTRLYFACVGTALRPSPFVVSLGDPVTWCMSS